MSEEECNLVIGALDSLGVALANHDHEWTEGERCIYESAVGCIERVQNSKRAKNRRKYKLDCPCGFEGNTHNIREHRSACEIWHNQIKPPGPASQTDKP